MTGPRPLDADKLAAAKLWLTSTPATGHASRVGDAPYLSSAVYSLITVATDEVADLTADESWRLYINPDWLEATDVPAVAGRIAHVTYHLLMDHAGRARSLHVGRRERAAWTTAADVGVAECLADSDLPHDDVPLPQHAGLPAGLSAEERYALLSGLPVPPPDEEHAADEPDEGALGPRGPNCGSAADGVGRLSELPAGADVGRVGTVQAEELRRTVAIAYQAHRGPRGKEPAEWQRLVEDVLDPVVPWQLVLTASVRRAVAWTSGLTDYTYSRRSRRQAAAPSVVLPGTRRPVPETAIVVDTSGSVHDGLLAQALGEIEGALRSAGSTDGSMRVLSTDAAVHTIQRVRRARDVELIGGGGTDMREGVAAAAQLRPRPDITIVLTDGETPWPAGPPPGMVVIAAVLGHQRKHLPATPRWATRVECVPR